IQIDSDGITLDGNGYSPSIHIFEKEGFIIKNLIDSHGVGLYSNSYSIIQSYIIDNTFKNGNGAIEFFCANNVTIKNNKILNNEWSGIYLTYSKNITITGNTIDNNTDYGISSWDTSSENNITNNTFDNNSCCILCDQSCCQIIKNNYFSNSNSGIGQVLTGNIIIDNTFSNTQTGIYLGDGTSCDIINNNFLMNEYGIYISPGCYMSSTNNNITDNIILNNEYGICISPYTDEGDNINNNIIENNTISSNNKGIHIDNVTGTLLYQNNIVNNNDYNAYEYLESGSNQWDNGATGNHWSDFDEPCEGCNDADNNGICDSVYNIPGGSGIDNYPIVNWIYEWIGEESDGGSAVTTSELQEAIYHWLNNIPVRGHILSTANLQNIINLWLSG
ncbi:MAG: right-handed parallel beta-helix repeat-containing protein, partial [Methanosarcinales archaeon]|nr:right-handed parallel beta-helix repeat-containing protein [Methanosarcinales archaeon]